MAEAANPVSSIRAGSIVVLQATSDHGHQKCQKSDQRKKSYSSYTGSGSTTKGRVSSVEIEAIVRPEGCPSQPTTSKAPPDAMQTPLMTHQIEALSWANWRENSTQIVRGGILADDMGLGKTITMLAIIADGWTNVPCGPTLVVMPLSVLRHWEAEISRHLQSCKVIIYHGRKKELEKVAESSRTVVLTTYETLAGGFGTALEGSLASSRDSSCKKSEVKAILLPEKLTGIAADGLFGIRWHRLVLDEGHEVRNCQTKSSKACCAITAEIRWIVTGTPINNCLKELYTLLGKFLRCGSLSDAKIWKRVIVDHENGHARVGVLLSALSIRRTKDQKRPDGKPIVPLPQRTCINHDVHLWTAERKKYTAIMQTIAKSGEGSSGLVKITRLRQICCHPALLPSMPVKPEILLCDLKPNMPSQKSEGQVKSVSSNHLASANCTPDHKNHEAMKNITVTGSEKKQLISSKSEKISFCRPKSSLIFGLPSSKMCGGKKNEITGSVPNNCELDHSINQLTNTLNTLQIKETAESSKFPAKDNVLDQTSSKLEAFLIEFNKMREGRAEDGSKNKAVVISQWSKFLDVIAHHLTKSGTTILRIDGSVGVNVRQNIVNEFNTGETDVMLLSLDAGGVGLNLVGANHCFVLDLPYNPSTLDQACDRVYRVGQKRKVCSVT